MRPAGHQAPTNDNQIKKGYVNIAAWGKAVEGLLQGRRVLSPAPTYLCGLQPEGGI